LYDEVGRALLILQGEERVSEEDEWGEVNFDRAGKTTFLIG